MPLPRFQSLLFKLLVFLAVLIPYMLIEWSGIVQLPQSFGIVLILPIFFAPWLLEFLWSRGIGFRFFPTPARRQLAWYLDLLTDGASSLKPGEGKEHIATGQIRPGEFWQELLADLLPRDVEFTDPVATSITDVGHFRLNANVISDDGRAILIHLETEHNRPFRIAELSYKPGILPVTSWESLDAVVSALAPQTCFLVARITDGSCDVVHAMNVASSLPIGEADTLLILTELARQIGAGEVFWNEVLNVDGSSRSGSLPVGDPQEDGVYALAAPAPEVMLDENREATNRLGALLGNENIEVLAAAIGFSRSGASPAVWHASAEDVCHALATLNQQAAMPGFEPLSDIMGYFPGFSLIPGQFWPYLMTATGDGPGFWHSAWMLQRADGSKFVVVTGATNPGGHIDDWTLRSVILSAAKLLYDQSRAGPALNVVQSPIRLRVDGSGSLR